MGTVLGGRFEKGRAHPAWILCLFIVIVGVALIISQQMASSSEGVGEEKPSPRLNFFVYPELADFLEGDNTDREDQGNCADYARQLFERAENRGHKMFYVILFPMEGPGHALNATFVRESAEDNSISTRLVWIEPQTDEVFVPLDVGDNYNLLLAKGSKSSFIIWTVFIFE